MTREKIEAYALHKELYYPQFTKEGDWGMKQPHLFSHLNT